MTALISWLDASPEEQRRVREVVQLFSQKETQDELGGRRIVVALSDLLFPGTSVLHTRARYLFFIPWFCKDVATKKSPIGELEWLERRLIGSFISDSEVVPDNRLDGLIGREAGPKVKQLPSSAYWTALVEWGILRQPGTISQTLDRSRSLAENTAGEDLDELAERAQVLWHPGVGSLPKGFPSSTIDGGFRLTTDEASYLRERWLETTDGSLLAHLARRRQALTGHWAPWLEPACQTAGPAITSVLEEAERFSIAIDGARILYHLLVAERYLKAGYTRAEVDPDALRDQLDEWSSEVAERAALFDGWDRAGFWALVRGQNARVDELSRRFFDTWFGVAERGAIGVAGDVRLRELVEARERFLKRSQARLVNPKLLAGWRGGVPGRVTFRWSQVSRLVNDVVEGLDAGA